MAQSDYIEVQDDDEAADMLDRFSSTELRALASNAGVSRSRGDTKRETAEKIVAQDPALAARIIENYHEVDMSADAFREAREVGEDRISLDEAAKRARSDRMRWKLERLARSLEHVPSYEGSVEWEYGGEVTDEGYKPGVTSIQASRRDDAPKVHWVLDERVHLILTEHGRCVLFDVGDSRYIDRNTPDPGKQWKLGLSRIERLYESSEE